MSAYTAKNFELTRSVGFMLTKARNVVNGELDAALAELDISNQQIGILLSLFSGMASTPFELAKMLGIDTGLMTRMLDKLERKGLLRRSRDAQDRRVVNLALTEKGEEAAVRIPDIAQRVLDVRLRKFTNGEFETFRLLLHKFTDD